MSGGVSAQTSAVASFGLARSSVLSGPVASPRSAPFCWKRASTPRPRRQPPGTTSSSAGRHSAGYLLRPRLRARPRQRRRRSQGAARPPSSARGKPPAFVPARVFGPNPLGDPGSAERRPAPRSQRDARVGRLPSAQLRSGTRPLRRAKRKRLHRSAPDPVLVRSRRLARLSRYASLGLKAGVRGRPPQMVGLAAAEATTGS